MYYRMTLFFILFYFLVSAIFFFFPSNSKFLNFSDRNASNYVIALSY